MNNCKTIQCFFNLDGICFLKDNQTKEQIEKCSLKISYDNEEE